MSNPYPMSKSTDFQKCTIFITKTSSHLSGSEKSWFRCVIIYLNCMPYRLNLASRIKHFS